MSNESTRAEELKMDENIETQIEKAEERFGEIIPEHKEILSEEEDVLEKLEIAHEVIDHSKTLQQKLINQSTSDGVDGEILQELIYSVAILRNIQNEIADLNKKIKSEGQELKQISDWESQLEEESETLVNAQSQLLNSDQRSDETEKKIENWTEKLQGATAEGLRNYTEKIKG